MEVRIKAVKVKTKAAKQGMVKTKMAFITPKVRANMDKEPRVMDKIKAKDNMVDLDKRMVKIVALDNIPKASANMVANQKSEVAFNPFQDGVSK
uniref:Uncharacterized protein n=1 Tax=Acrobeloides nanus TaxID=290746 RepID=A0A914EB34_9BILA